MDNQKREKYESPAVEVLTVAVEYGFAGSGGDNADTTLPGWGHEDGYWEYSSLVITNY
ncbi:hypothetical protein [Bacteroides sp.]